MDYSELKIQFLSNKV